jgi:hypothetical protein
LALLAGGFGMVSAEEPEARALSFEVKGVFDRSLDAAPSKPGESEFARLMPRRFKDMGKATCIETSAGETKSLTRGSQMKEGDALLLGNSQVFGRFGDGVALYASPFTAMKITKRTQTDNNECETVLDFYQGALRVNMPRISSKGTFVVRLPDIKQGPVSITGRRGSHFFVFLDPSSFDTKSRTVDLQIQVLGGKCEVSLPRLNETGDIAQGDSQPAIHEVPAGSALRVPCRFENTEDAAPLCMVTADSDKRSPFTP